MMKKPTVLWIVYGVTFLLLVLQIISGFFMRDVQFLRQVHTVNIWFLMVFIVMHWIVAIPQIRNMIYKRSPKKST